jgi:NAD+ synthase (glutamine-hydrolysing)
MIETLSLKSIKIGLCQQPCIPANPKYNGEYFTACIDEAEQNNTDLLVGVEGMQGYLIGDQYEYSEFLKEVDLANERIRISTTGKQVMVAYGSVIVPDWSLNGRDGRTLKHNGGYILQNGKILRVSNKTLSPDYRMFPEARYFMDQLRRALYGSMASNIPVGKILSNLLVPVDVTMRNGQAYKLGQTFCEDMWWEDHGINPTAILAENGADIIINHSASPWTWRKNNKRHRVVKELLSKIRTEIRPKLFIYVNRTGMEQSNKNFYIYDGSSAVYDSDGDLIFEVEPYYQGTKTFLFGDNPKIEGRTPDDTVALHDAMACFVDNFFGAIPEDRRFVEVGLSGGIDSAVVFAFLASRACLKGRVRGTNMPYDNYNAAETISDAQLLAKNVHVPYSEIDITKMVDEIASATGVSKSTLAHQNIQARCRMEVLAALAQREEILNGLTKKGGLFTANGNKDEMTFGFGTMYGDVAGAIMLLVDLVKREVYELGRYLNEHVYKREVIPTRIFARKPTAELDSTHSMDPFDYGDLNRRGYHDEWVRAVTEFRWSPMQFLTEYANGTLEKSMILPQGHLTKLFPTAESFVKRLERDWNSFTGSYWKRMQCPPGPVFTRRAYGGDLSESLYTYPPTASYKEFKEKILVAAATTK